MTTRQNKKWIIFALGFAVFFSLGRWCAHRAFQTRQDALPAVPTPTVSNFTRSTDSAVAKNKTQPDAPTRSELRAFLKAGWHRVRAAPPDYSALLSEPNPASEKQAEELHTVLQTAAFSPSDVGTLSNIARETDDAKTRYLAIDAISRMPAPQAENALAALYDEVRGAPLQDAAARDQILTSLEPSSANSDGGRFLISLLGRASVTDDAKKTAFSSLVSLAVSSAEARRDLQSALPSEWSARFAQAMRNLGTDTE